VRLSVYLDFQGAMLLSLGFLLATPAPAAPAARAGPSLGADITRLTGPLREASALTAPADRADWSLRHRDPYPDPERVTVVVELLEGGDGWTVADAAMALDPDIVDPVVAGSYAQLRVPFERLADVAALPDVRRVRTPLLARPTEVISEGVEPMGLEDWQAGGLTGAGVRIGVLDVGFAGYEALLGEELPASVEARFSGDWESSGHGAAVAEVIHDIAPGAELYLYNFLTDVEFIDRLNEILDDGVQVVNASVGFDNVWPIDGSSPWSQGVDQLAEYGVIYVAAAGNEAGNYASGALTDSDGDGWLELDGDDSVQFRTRGGQASASFRWSDDPLGSGTDIDLFVYSGDSECGRSQEVQDGDGFPYETVTCSVTGSWAEARLYSEQSVSGLTGWIYSAGGVHSDNATPEGTLTLPADALGAFTIGAYDPETKELAEYSSQGPTADGRVKPDYVAPTGVSTVTYGSGYFEGTSASAPHAAGLIALLLERKPRASVGKVRKLLTERVEDLGEEGPDNLFGEGALQAMDLPCGCVAAGAPARSGAAWLLPLFSLMALARRRA